MKKQLKEAKRKLLLLILRKNSDDITDVEADIACALCRDEDIRDVMRTGLMKDEKWDGTHRRWSDNSIE